MADVSNTNREQQTEFPPAIQPNFCTISLSDGMSIPLYALHSELSPDPLTRQGASCTAHSDPLYPSSCTHSNHIDNSLCYGIDPTFLSGPGSPLESSVPGAGSPSPARRDRSPSFDPSPPQLLPPQRLQAIAENVHAAPQGGDVPAGMMTVFSVHTREGPPSPNQASEEIAGPPTSGTASESLPFRRTPPSSRRDPRCTCSLPPDVDWVRHWRRSCRSNPDRRYLCPKGCGQEFTRKDNAKRHVRLGECPLFADGEPA